MWKSVKKSGIGDIKAKLVWDFEFNLQKTATSRRSDLMFEEKEKKPCTIMFIIFWDFFDGWSNFTFTISKTKCDY